MLNLKNFIGGGKTTLILTILLTFTLTLSVYTVAENVTGSVSVKSHGKVNYIQDGKDILIDAADINDLATAVNTLNEEVSSIENSLTELLPIGEGADISNILSLIVGGTASTGDVLENKTFSSGSGISQVGTIPIKEDINVSSAKITTCYDDANENINIKIPEGYYADGKYVNIDVEKYNSTIYMKGYQDGVDSSSVNVVANYNYHQHSLTQNDLIKTASSFSDWQDAIVELNDDAEATEGGCYQTILKHSHTGNSSSGGGCYTVARTGYYSCGGCQKNSYNCGGCQRAWTLFGENQWGWGYECPGHTSWSCPGNHPYTYYDLGCGKNTETIEGYSTTCGYTNGELISVLIEF